MRKEVIIDTISLIILYLFGLLFGYGIGYQEGNEKAYMEMNEKVETVENDYNNMINNLDKKIEEHNKHCRYKLELIKED